MTSDNDKLWAEAYEDYKNHFREHAIIHKFDTQMASQNLKVMNHAELVQSITRDKFPLRR